MRKFSNVGLLLFLIYSFNVAGVSIHSPLEWGTLRGTNVIAKVYIDTLKTGKKPIDVALIYVRDGHERKIFSKTYNSEDYSQEYNLGSVDDKTVGGVDYLKINWSVRGTDIKGTVAPIGIAVLDEKNDVVSANAVSVTNVSFDALKEKINIGGSTIYFSWDKKNLGILVSDYSATARISVAFDGKNGKNAFFAFSDRKITYYPDSDSIETLYYDRNVEPSGGIVYVEKKWVGDIVTEVKGEKLLISIPWYDLGIIPSDGRMFGIVVTVEDKDGKKISLPANSDEMIPATWGNCKLSSHKE